MKCILCNTNKAIPGYDFCSECEERELRRMRKKECEKQLEEEQDEKK